MTSTFDIDIDVVVGGDRVFVLKKKKKKKQKMSKSSRHHGSLEGILLGILSILFIEYRRAIRKRNKYELAYWNERRGRVRVEKEMKNISNIRLNTSEGFFIKPIGEIQSCYKNCIGTPRQGLLVPNARASVSFIRNISPEALDGLQDYSHVWIIFEFHLNTNRLKESKAFDDQNNKTFVGKINLPMLKDKLGVFATRSPHRPNPIGITLARIRAVDKSTRTLHLHACDLVHGTPVFDVKPFVPMYDGAPDVRVPNWIENTITHRNVVTINPECYQYIEKNAKHLKLFHNESNEFFIALIQTLQVEVRSKFQTKKLVSFSKQKDQKSDEAASAASNIVNSGSVAAAKDPSFSAESVSINEIIENDQRFVEFLFDETIVKYEWKNEHEFYVFKVLLLKDDKEKLKELRELEKSQELLGDEAASVLSTKEEIEGAAQQALAKLF